MKIKMLNSIAETIREYQARHFRPSNQTYMPIKSSIRYAGKPKSDHLPESPK